METRGYATAIFLHRRNVIAGFYSFVGNKMLYYIEHALINFFHIL